MATFKNGILSGFSGRVGPVVGVQTGDRFIMRARPRSRSSFTEKELENQAKFKLVQNYLSPFKDLLKIGFNNYYTKTGGFRAAVSYTRKEALKTNDTGFHIAPELLKISGGNLTPAINPSVQFTAEQEVILTWDTSQSNYLNEADQLMLLIYNAENGTALTKGFNGAFRKDGILKVKWGKKMIGVNLDIYIGFVAADRSSQSDSQYLGRFSF